MRWMQTVAVAAWISMIFLAACSKSQDDPLDLLAQEGADPLGGDTAAIDALGRDAGQSLPLEDDVMRPTGPGVSAEGLLSTIYFDYDQSNIRIDQRAGLDGNYQYLAANPQVRILIEGHCDERGTVEYNFALGESRARVAREYLMHRGIDGLRIKTLSYGEEAPEIIGKGEAVWSKNRRAEFKFEL